MDKIDRIIWDFIKDSTYAEILFCGVIENKLCVKIRSIKCQKV